MMHSTAGRNGPPHREGPADENGATSTTTNQPKSATQEADRADFTSRLRVYAQATHADLGLVEDDGRAVGT